MTADSVLPRRLAAILAADVAGYSRLMEADEAGTLARFRAIRGAVLDPRIAAHGGRVVGSAGDSLLVEFTNALAAVTCALECQEALAAHNAALPEPQHILFRMGVNLGDIIAADGTIHGDGVNVAARLEKLAEPGGICVSRNVFEQIDGKIDIGFTDLGKVEVKNIAKPIRVFRALMSGTVEAGSPKPGRDSDRFSIAILPFDNMSGDPDQGYFSDGITEDIITELSRFRELVVIARHSSFQFRGKERDIQEVARRLNAQLVVEGSVRKIGNRVRVTAQLIEAKTAAHLWAEHYDRDLTDVFAIQDEITQSIVAQVAKNARSAFTSHLRSRPTESLTAYDYFLQARVFFWSDADTWKAEPLLLKAIALDPGFADAYSRLSVVHTIKQFHDARAEHLDDALQAAQTALTLDRANPLSNHAMGLVLIFLSRFDEAGHYLRQAMTLNPNECFIRADYAMWLHFVGEQETALEEIDEALRRDPYAHDWFWCVRGMIESCLGNFAAAVASFNRTRLVTGWVLWRRAICHIELNNPTAAAVDIAELRKLTPDLTAEDYLPPGRYRNAETQARLVDALRRALDLA